MSTCMQWIRRAWIACVTGASALFGLFLALTPVTRGLGIAVDGRGMFHLKQGTAEMAIHQGLGLLLFIATYLFGFLCLAALLLSLLVFLRHGTLGLGTVFKVMEPTDRVLLAALHVSAGILSLGCAILVVLLFVRSFGG